MSPIPRQSVPATVSASRPKGGTLGAAAEVRAGLMRKWQIGGAVLLFLVSMFWQGVWDDLNLTDAFLDFGPFGGGLLLAVFKSGPMIVAIGWGAYLFAIRKRTKGHTKQPEEVSLVVGGAGGDHSAVYRRVQTMNKTKLYIWIAALAAGSLIWAMLMDVAISGRLSLVNHFGAGISLGGIPFAITGIIAGVTYLVSKKTKVAMWTWTITLLIVFVALGIGGAKMGAS